MGAPQARKVALRRAPKAPVAPQKISELSSGTQKSSHTSRVAPMESATVRLCGNYNYEIARGERLVAASGDSDLWYYHFAYLINVPQCCSTIGRD